MSHLDDDRMLPAVQAARYELTVDDVLAQAHKIQEIAAKAMKDGEHFGVIPGTSKPTLLQPGAQKLMLTFRLDPEYDSVPVAPDLGGGGHLTIKSKCTLYHIPTSQRMGSGEGSCSTREEKYAYRHAARKCPACGAEAIIKGKEEYGGGWVCFKKKGGCNAKYKDGDGAIEAQVVGRVANESLPDSYNTVLKIANKRALVAATLNATAASDVFTQDLEDAPQEPAPPKPDPRPEVMTDSEGVEHVGHPGRTYPVPGEESRDALLQAIKAIQDREKMKMADRTEWWEKYVGGGTIDPRGVDVSVLQDLYAALKGQYGE